MSALEILQSLLLTRSNRETNLDDVMQISNVFVNVSKGEVAKHGDLQKAFGKMDTDSIIKEVRYVPESLIAVPYEEIIVRSSRQENSKSEKKSASTISPPSAKRSQL